MKRFEYSPLGSELKYKTDIAKKKSIKDWTSFLNLKKKGDDMMNKVKEMIKNKN